MPFPRRLLALSELWLFTAIFLEKQILYPFSNHLHAQLAPGDNNRLDGLA